MHDARSDHSPGTALGRLLAGALLLALAACGNDGDDRDGSRGDAGADEASALPSPEGATGSVTGMPGNPGPGTAPLTGIVEANPADQAYSTSGEVATDQATPVDGVFVLSEAPLFPPAPESPAVSAPPAPPTPSPPEPRAAFVQPAEDAPEPPAGTAAATESTTIVVPADPED